jgi:hypothetical protein
MLSIWRYTGMLSTRCPHCGREHPVTDEDYKRLRGAFNAAVRWGKREPINVVAIKAIPVPKSPTDPRLDRGYDFGA